MVPCCLAALVCSDHRHATARPLATPQQASTCVAGSLPRTAALVASTTMGVKRLRVLYLQLNREGRGSNSAAGHGREALSLFWEGGPLTLLGGRPSHSFGPKAHKPSAAFSLCPVHPSPPIPSISQPPPLPPHGHIESFETYIPHPPLPPPSPLLLHRDVEGLEADERKRGVGGVHQSDEEELPVTAWGEDMRNWWATQIWFPCLQ